MMLLRMVLLNITQQFFWGASNFQWGLPHNIYQTIFIGNLITDSVWTQLGTCQILWNLHWSFSYTCSLGKLEYEWMILQDCGYHFVTNFKIINQSLNPLNVSNTIMFWCIVGLKNRHYDFKSMSSSKTKIYCNENDVWNWYKITMTKFTPPLNRPSSQTFVESQISSKYII